VDLDHGLASGIGIEALPIPAEGLAEVLGGWSGQGHLWAGLATVQDDFAIGRVWTPTDVRRRAHRVLMERLKPSIRMWPSNLHKWTDSLPAETVSYRSNALATSSATSWSETRIIHGWPPRAFVDHVKNRTADSLLATTLRWTFESLAVVVRDALHLESGLADDIQGQLSAALDLLNSEPLIGAPALMPTRTDVLAFSREGRPWNLVSPVTEYLRTVSASLPTLARELIMPSPELAWRLFHLAVLGTVLVSATRLGAKLLSLRPLSGATNGPTYQLTDLKGDTWDLWFEGAGAWAYYKAHSIYTDAVRGLRDAPRPLSPDILLIRPGGRALLIECKYSANPDVVGRSGVLQALGYSLELRESLSTDVVAVVVGPSSVVKSSTSVRHNLGTVGVAPPEALSEILRHLLPGY
jgi:hypothetical protein